VTDTTVSGRHRTPGRHNPLTEITAMVARAGESGVKASAVLAASGGLVAAFALPAQAAPAAAPASVPAAAPAAVTAEPATVAAAPAVVAPQAAAPAVLAAVGVVGVTAVEKPAPAPEPAPVATPRPTSTTQASRSTTRTSSATTAAPVATYVPSAVGGSVLDIAAAYSGIPYLYGGTTPAGFDCSGFTQFVFGQAGISLPRTATAQLFATTRVSDPQPGDLVFFGDGSYAYHVGIYAGNGMMYDSPRSGKLSGLRAIWSSNVIYGRV
jgi:cell wall-associated NlpC family hydrolase